MAKLISDEQIEAIKDVFRDVTDTFFVTPVLYKRLSVNMDRLNVGNGKKTFTEYNLKALVEYTDQDTDRVLLSAEGKLNKQRVVCSFNYRDLKAAEKVGGGTEDLTTAENFVVLRSEKDFMVVNGKEYEVEYIGLDGPINAENVLLIVKGKIEESDT